MQLIESQNCLEVAKNMSLISTTTDTVEYVVWSQSTSSRVTLLPRDLVCSRANRESRGKCVNERVGRSGLLHDIFTILVMRGRSFSLEP